MFQATLACRKVPALDTHQIHNSWPAIKIQQRTQQLIHQQPVINYKSKNVQLLPMARGRNFAGGFPLALQKSLNLASLGLIGCKVVHTFVPYGSRKD